MKVIFMGSPDFAVPSLKLLAKSDDFQVPLVITQPPRKSGRNQKVNSTPVGKTASNLKLNIKPVKNVNKKEHVEEMIKIAPDFVVVAAFGQILQKEVLQVPDLAPVNLHASLLPKYRGASPIQHAIMNGDKITGVTTIIMDQGLDTGDILKQYEVKIQNKETAGSLHDKLAVKGSHLTIDTLREFSRGEIEPRPQNEDLASYTPKLSKNDGEISFNRQAAKLVNKIRGLNPWPGAYTFFRGKRLKLLQAKSVSGRTEKLKPGTVVYADKNNGLQIKTARDNLKLEEVQPADSKVISGQDFINGYQPERGELFGR